MVKIRTIDFDDRFGEFQLEKGKKRHVKLFTHSLDMQEISTEMKKKFCPNVPFIKYNQK